MKYLRHCAIPFIALITAMCSCGSKDNPEPTPDPTPKAPTAITLSTSSITASADGESYDITVKSPFVPKVEKPDWVDVSFGTLTDFTVTATVVVSPNTAFEGRSATLTFSATGATSATLSVSQAAAEIPTPGEEKGLASFFGLGWNLGNHFDAYYNGSWAGEKEGYPAEDAWDGTFATQATFDGVKNAGFTSVRIPVTWLKMIGDAPDYTINEAWINRVYEVVQFAHNAGLKVIINTHHDENHGVNNTYQWLDIKNASNNAELNIQIKSKIKGAWTNIANKFKDCGDDWLMMEGFNELNDGGWGWSADFRANPTKQTKILDEWNQEFVNAVRATGGYNATRWLSVPSYCANPEFTKYMVLPDDPAGKLAVSVHFYDPSDYTIGEAQYSDWGHTGAAGKKADGGDEDHVKSVFGKLYSTYVAKGVPVYVGEFGCSMRSKSDSRAWAFYKYYMEYVVKAAKTYNLPCFLWDNGTDGNGQEQHGYIHHGTGNYIGNSKDVVDVMKKAWFTESEGYTLETVYNSAPKFSMKKTMILATLLAVCSCGGSGKKPMESPKDQLVHRLFTFAENGQIAYGHQDDLAYGHSWCVTDWENDPLDRSDVKAVTGKYPMVTGFDLGGIELGAEANLDGVPFGLMRKASLKHMERGGIVTFSWHPRNPLTGGDAWDISSAEVVRSVLPGGEKNADFRIWLQRAADFIESLGDVAVIFRPWHENTGSWFWWGEKLCSARDYQELFRMTWLYFVKERGLTNILWCYSPGGDAGPQRSMDRYPGDEFVDILAVDTYEFVGSGSVEEARVRYQEELKSALTFLTAAGMEHQKLIALSETGLEGLPDLTWWTKTLYPAIKDYPISYVLTWRNAHDKPGHFYAAWEGFEGAPDMKAFSELDSIVFLD